jgi:hypothetical protein
MINVDLKSRVVSDQHQVYLVRPGANYRLHTDFYENSAIISDLVGLDFQRGVPLLEQPNLVAQIRRAKALKRWHHNRNLEAPSRELGAYSAIGRGSSVAQLQRILEGFFLHSKKGDLVVVPPKGFSLDTYIGELTEPPGRYRTFEVPRHYGEEKLYGRKVRWLGKLKKADLSPYLLDLIAKPNAFVLIGREERKVLYREAYGSFSWADEHSSRLEVTTNTFTSSDDLRLQVFINLISANTMMIEQGRELIGISDAVFMDLEGYAPDLQSNINSPGYLNLRSAEIAPLVVAAMLAIALVVGPEAASLASSGDILIGNSLAPAGDACSLAVSDQVVQQLRLMGIGDWTRACELAMQTAESTGLIGQAVVSNQ